MAGTRAQGPNAIPKKETMRHNAPSHPELDNAGNNIQLDKIVNERTRRLRQGQSHRI